MHRLDGDHQCHLSARSGPVRYIAGWVPVIYSFAYQVSESLKETHGKVNKDPRLFIHQMTLRKFFSFWRNVAIVYWLEQQEYYEEYVAAHGIFGFLSSALVLQTLLHRFPQRSRTDKWNTLVPATWLGVGIVNKTVGSLLIGSSNMAILTPRSLLLTELLDKLTVNIWPGSCFILIRAHICISANLSVSPWRLLVGIFRVIIAVILGIFLLLEAQSKLLVFVHFKFIIILL